MPKIEKCIKRGNCRRRFSKKKMDSKNVYSSQPTQLLETPQETFIRGFVEKFNPNEPMFLRALKSVYTVNTELEETRRIAEFFSSIGLVPPRLDEWSIVVGAAAAKKLLCLSI